MGYISALTYYLLLIIGEVVSGVASQQFQGRQRLASPCLALRHCIDP